MRNFANRDGNQNLGEEAILLGKIGEAGASEPLKSCYILFPYEVWENFVEKSANGKYYQERSSLK
jgi:hypothetical protein